MKKVLCFLAMTMLMVSCGGNGQTENGDGGSAPKTKAAKSGISLGDKFAFAGLDSDKLVPSFAVELSELATDPRSEANPMKDEVFFYTGSTINAVSADKVQAYLQQVYNAVKKAADDGVVFGTKGMFDNQLGLQVNEPPTTDKPAATVMYLYKHDGKWFYISAGHKAYFRQFVKEYDNFIGVGVSVKEILGGVE